jgi:hypothetical protein
MFAAMPVSVDDLEQALKERLEIGHFRGLSLIHDVLHMNESDAYAATMCPYRWHRSASDICDYSHQGNGCSIIAHLSGSGGPN